jgi:hypothetical protein
VSIDPLASPALRSADLALAGADAGLAVEDVVLSFTQSAAGVVVVRDTSFSVLGGRVRAAGRLDTEGERALVLDVAGVDFGVLLERIGVPGLTGRGTIDGRLPLHRAHGRLEIREGHLEARLPGGWLRYRPDVETDALPPAVKGSALVASVLQNLQFQRLEVDLEGEAMGEIDLRLHLLGHNPDVYGGVPVELIIEDRKLPLAATLRVANAGERLIRALDRRLERFDLTVISD